jgi:hypothetical protein
MASGETVEPDSFVSLAESSAPVPLTARGDFRQAFR